MTEGSKANHVKITQDVVRVLLQQIEEQLVGRLASQVESIKAKLSVKDPQLTQVTGVIDSLLLAFASRTAPTNITTFMDDVDTSALIYETALIQSAPALHDIRSEGQSLADSISYTRSDELRQLIVKLADHRQNKESDEIAELCQSYREWQRRRNQNLPLSEDDKRLVGEMCDRRSQVYRLAELEGTLRSAHEFLLKPTLSCAEVVAIREAIERIISPWSSARVAPDPAELAKDIRDLRIGAASRLEVDKRAREMLSNEGATVVSHFLKNLNAEYKDTILRIIKFGTRIRFAPITSSSSFPISAISQ